MKFNPKYKKIRTILNFDYGVKIIQVEKFQNCIDLIKIDGVLSELECVVGDLEILLGICKVKIRNALDFPTTFEIIVVLLKCFICIENYLEITYSCIMIILNEF